VIDWFKLFFIAFFNNVRSDDYERAFYNRMFKENVAISLTHNVHYEVVPDAKQTKYFPNPFDWCTSLSISFKFITLPEMSLMLAMILPMAG
jgi:hypothetical protein